MIENTVINFLNDIVSEIHAPQEIGPNRFTIEMKSWTDINGVYIYVGNKRHLYCEQEGQELHIYYLSNRFLLRIRLHFQIDLTNPASREQIANIFRTN